MNYKTFAIIGIAFVFGVAGAMLLSSDSGNDSENDRVEGNMLEIEQLAEDWIIENSPTYSLDGSDLVLEESVEMEEGNVFRFTFSFVSSSAGYGDRRDEMAAQVLTPHTMVVTVADGEVVEAITDDVFNEMTGEYIGDAEAGDVE